MFSSIFSEEIIKAISWTLLYSLWQGMILAIVTGCIIVTTKKSKPVLRYNLFVSAILIFVIIAAVTFIAQINHTISFEPKTATQFSGHQPEIISVDWEIVEYNTSFIGKTKILINTYAVWIALCWFLIITFKFLRMGLGVYGMYRLKTKQVSPVEVYWKNKIDTLCKELHIIQKIQLLQSGIIKVPAVVGYFKPVILFPAAMFTALPMHEIEAILIHELGHIRRRDFLVNFLQHMVEIIFFFNPAVLWVSSLIKAERENCCDEITISSTGNKKGYIQALLNFENLQIKTPQLATAFAGQKNSLLNRVERIIYNKNKTLNNMEKKFLTISLLVLSICLLAFVSNKAQTPEKKQRENKIEAAKPISATPGTLPLQTDTVPGKQPVTNNSLHGIPQTQALDLPTDPGFTGRSDTQIEGKEIKIFWDNGIPYELYIDGKKIPDEKLGDYKSTIAKLRKQIEIDIVQSRRDAEQSRLDAEQSRKDAEQSRLDAEQSRSAAAQSRLDAEQSRKDAGQSRRDANQSFNEMQERMKFITNYLISENVIKNSDGLKSIKLNNKELIINGKKQSEKIHATLKAKYVKSEGWAMDLRRSGNTESGTVTDKSDGTNTNGTHSPISPISPISPRDSEKSRIVSEESAKDREFGIKDKEQSARDREQAAKDRETFKEIIEDVIANNIVKKRREIHNFKFNAEELVVNGVKQPEALHKKFKSKYVTSSIWSWAITTVNN